MGGGGCSKSDSCAAWELACWFGAVTGFSYSHVLATSRSAADTKATREANFGTTIQVLATSFNSLSREAMAAMTRVANHGRAIVASEPTFLKISLAARRSWAASRQRGQEAMWVLSAADKSAHSSSTLA